MTARPIGAAIDPPVASAPSSPPFSTITATAMLGASAGANATYQPCGLSSGSPCWAVPVLDAISTPEILPSPLVFCSDCSIMSRIVRATSGETAWFSSSGCISLITDLSGAVVLRTSSGFISLPPLAIAETIIAFCSGVTRTSR